VKGAFLELFRTFLKLCGGSFFGAFLELFLFCLFEGMVRRKLKFPTGSRKALEKSHQNYTRQPLSLH
jgi:hypothetical protein